MIAKAQGQKESPQEPFSWKIVLLLSVVSTVIIFLWLNLNGGQSRAAPLYEDLENKQLCISAIQRGDLVKVYELGPKVIPNFADSASKGELLIHAVVYNRVEIVHYLLTQHHINPNTKDNMGFSVLHMAAINDYENVIHDLVDHNADLNIRDSFGWTPLHNAAFYGKNIAIKALIARNAIIDIEDSEGNTPLHIAIKQNLPETVKTLLKNGANPNAMNSKGMGALEFAVSLGVKEAQTVLENN